MKKKYQKVVQKKKKDYKCGAVKNKCAPGVEYDAKNKTCFSMESLIKLANKFNLKHSNDKIDIKQDKKYLLKN